MANRIQLEEGLSGEIRVNEEFYIELISNSSIGYGWSAHYDQSALKLIDAGTRGGTNVPGSNQQTIWTFRAKKPGRHTLNFTTKWLRQLEDAGTETKKYTINVKK